MPLKKFLPADLHPLGVQFGTEETVHALYSSLLLLFLLSSTHQHSIKIEASSEKMRDISMSLIF
jgi:hypothetical protein